MDRRKGAKLHVVIDALPDSEGHVREMLSYLVYAKRIAGFSVVAEGAPASSGAKAAGALPAGTTYDQLVRWKLSQQLVRVKGKSDRGEPLDLPCKIMSYDFDDGTVSLYDVDRKQVERLKFEQIEDMRPARS